VIAHEEMDVNAFLGQAAQFFEERIVLMLALIVDEILHPEIEHVAQHVDGDGILAHLFQQFNHFLLVRPASLDSQTPHMRVT
jgi:hypothetical protein